MDTKKFLANISRGQSLSEMVQEYNRTRDWWAFRSRAWVHLEYRSPAYNQLSALNPFSKTPVWEACARNYIALLIVLIEAGLDICSLEMHEELAVQRWMNAWGCEDKVQQLYCGERVSRQIVLPIAGPDTSHYVALVRHLQDRYNESLFQMKCSHGCSYRDCSST